MKSAQYDHLACKEDRVGHLAAKQFGVVSRAQLIEAGIGPAAIRYRMKSGDLHQIHPGVFVVRGAPSSLNQKLVAARFWAGPQSAISHRAAAAAWGLDGVQPGKIVELTTTQRRSDVPAGLTLHSTKILTPSDAGWLGPLRVTSIPRTLVDLGAVETDPAVVEAAFESAVRRDEELPDKLRARLDIVGGHGRRGAGVLREILTLREADAAPTEGMFETRIERLLRSAGIEMPVRQFVVMVNGRPVRLDFAWVARKVALEPRGFGPHSGRKKFQSDIDRANALAATGWLIIYVTWRDLVRRPGYILERLLEVL